MDDQGLRVAANRCHNGFLAYQCAGIISMWCRHQYSKLLLPLLYALWMGGIFVLSYQYDVSATNYIQDQLDKYNCSKLAEEQVHSAKCSSLDHTYQYYYQQSATVVYRRDVNCAVEGVDLMYSSDMYDAYHRQYLLQAAVKAVAPAIMTYYVYEVIILGWYNLLAVEPTAHSTITWAKRSYRVGLLFLSSDPNFGIYMNLSTYFTSFYILSLVILTAHSFHRDTVAPCAHINANMLKSDLIENLIVYGVYGLCGIVYSVRGLLLLLRIDDLELMCSCYLPHFMHLVYGKMENRAWSKNPAQWLGAFATQYFYPLVLLVAAVLWVLNKCASIVCGVVMRDDLLYYLLRSSFELFMVRLNMQDWKPNTKTLSDNNGDVESGTNDGVEIKSDNPVHY